MRTEQYIPIRNVIVGRHSISEQTFDLACKIKDKTISLENLPPIKVVHKQGSYILKDGRHRITAFKLAGIKKIKAKFYKEK